MDFEWNVLDVVISLVSFGAAAALGFWLMRRVRIEPPRELRGGMLVAMAFKVWAWSIRLFVLLTVIVVVSAAALVLQPLLWSA